MTTAIEDLLKHWRNMETIPRVAALHKTLVLRKEPRFRPVCNSMKIVPHFGSLAVSLVLAALVAGGQTRVRSVSMPTPVCCLHCNRCQAMSCRRSGTFIWRRIMGPSPTQAFSSISARRGRGFLRKTRVCQFTRLGIREITLLMTLTIAIRQARSFLASLSGDVAFENSGPMFSMADLAGSSNLWLVITNVSNGLAYLNLNNATNQVYQIMTKLEPIS